VTNSLNYEIDSRRNELKSRCATLAKSLKNTALSIEQGEHSINSMGLVQGEGQAIDRLCAELGVLEDMKYRYYAQHSHCNF
jgi:hypothetical protein